MVCGFCDNCSRKRRRPCLACVEITLRSKSTPVRTKQVGLLPTRPAKRLPMSNLETAVYELCLFSRRWRGEYTTRNLLNPVNLGRR